MKVIYASNDVAVKLLPSLPAEVLSKAGTRMPDETTTAKDLANRAYLFPQTRFAN